jgi:hypothetical protein
MSCHLESWSCGGWELTPRRTLALAAPRPHPCSARLTTFVLELLVAFGACSLKAFPNLKISKIHPPQTLSPHIDTLRTTAATAAYPSVCSEITTTTIQSHCKFQKRNRARLRLADSFKLTTRPHFPSRICWRSCEARFSRRGHC